MKVTLKRPKNPGAGLTLGEVLTVSIILSPESPSSRTRTMLWIDNLSAQVVDVGENPKLKFSSASHDGHGHSHGPVPAASTDLARAIAKALQGELWNADRERWERK